ncbi:MAG: hypothetical protein H8K10_10715 [Nitrospira sp.]|nr:hypothetical protein [Nitrospira sp.]
MAAVTLNALPTPGFPVAVLFGDDQLPSHATGRAAAIRQPSNGTQNKPDPLNRRWFRYKIIPVLEYRNWLMFARRLAAEKYLTFDFLFPFAYGGALAGSLWWVWTTLGRPFHPAWITAPLAMILTADWTEHLIQLVQLRHYLPSTEGRIQSLWVRISNCATIIKLWLTLGFYVSLAGLVVRMILTLSDRRLVTAGDE